MSVGFKSLGGFPLGGGALVNPPPTAGFKSMLSVWLGGGAVSSITPTPTPTPSSAPTPAGEISRGRRRFIFPDGTQITATMEEARQLLARYATLSRETTAAKQPHRAKRRTMRVPTIELEAIRWERVPDTADDEALMPMLPKRMAWQPDPIKLAETVLMLRRKIDDEEALIALEA